MNTSLINEIAKRFNLRASSFTDFPRLAWTGKNPIEDGAKKDGFVLYEDGTAQDMVIEKTYTIDQVIKAAGIVMADAPLLDRMPKSGKFSIGSSFVSIPFPLEDEIEKRAALLESANHWLSQQIADNILHDSKFALSTSYQWERTVEGPFVTRLVLNVEYRETISKG